MSGAGTSSNRLLDLFQTELQKTVSTSSAGRAPSHGGASSVNNPNSFLPRPKKKRAGDGGFRDDTGFAGAEAGGRRVVRVETKLEKENAHLQEQLKFQGAVLDQLAGDVHTLERKAAVAGTGTAHFQPASTHHQEAGDDKRDGQEVRREEITDDALPEAQEDTAVCEGGCCDVHGRKQGVRTGCENVHEARGGVRDEPPSEHGDNVGKSSSSSCTDNNNNNNNQKGTADEETVGGSSGTTHVSSASTHNQQGTTVRGEHLNSLHEGPELPSAAAPDHLRPPKQAALGVPLQPSPAVVKEEEPAENAQLRFELREARKKAEAYRRKLAASRKTAEEKEQSHVDLLARERKFRAAVEAGLGEKVHSMRRRARDREARLSAELSSIKTQLRETVDLLTTKEEEVCSARTRGVQQEERAAATQAKYKERDRHASWLERRLEEVSSGEAAAATLRLEEMTAALETQQRELKSLRAFARDTTSIRKRHHQQQQQETDPRELEKREKNQHHVSPSNHGCFNGCSSVLKEGDDEISVAPNATAASETHEVNVASERTAVVPDADNNISPAKETSAAVNARKGHPTGDPVGTMKGDAVEDIKGDRMGDIKDDRKDDPNENDPAPESHCDDADERPPCPSSLQKTRLQSEGAERAEAPTESPSLGESPPLERGDELISSGEGGKKREKQKNDRQDREGGVWRTRGAAVDAEAELLARMRPCEEDSGGWQKEAVSLRVERQEMLRRLRNLAQEAHEKDQAISELQEAVPALESDLTKSREARTSLQRELRQQVQASRLLEKKAKSVEGLLSEAVALRVKAERAKTLLKARLTAVSRGCERSCIVGGEAKPTSAAAGDGSPPPMHGCSRCGGVDPGTVMPDRKEGLQFSDSREAGSGEEREKPPLEATKKASLVEPREQQHQLGQKLPGERHLEQERDVGHSRRNQDRQRQDLEEEQQKLETKREERHGEAELELKQEIERERRNFEVERQVLERERQESSLAAQHAENRVGELKAAWRALAEKVLSLAGRNADLEWALLKLRRESSSTDATRHVCGHSGNPARDARTSIVARRQQELGYNVSSDDNNSNNNDDDHDYHGNDNDRPSIASSVLRGGQDDNARRHEHDNGNAPRHEDGNAGVPRVSLNFGALFDAHQAAAGGGGEQAVGAEEG